MSDQISRESAAEVALADLTRCAHDIVREIPVGEGLDATARALVHLAVCVCVTSLDADAIDDAVEVALENGASVAQVQEIVALVSGLGVHSIMASATRVLYHAEKQELADSTAPLTAQQREYWQKFVGNDPYWDEFSRHLPGFLDAMLRLSPELFAGFFEYCAIPWKSGMVPALTKELAAMACDATPTHVFLPGFRVHIGNAIKLGAGQRAIRDSLEIAAMAPRHSIVR